MALKVCKIITNPSLNSYLAIVKITSYKEYRGTGTMQFSKQGNYKYYRYYNTELQFVAKSMYNCVY